MGYLLSNFSIVIVVFLKFETSESLADLASSALYRCAPSKKTHAHSLRGSNVLLKRFLTGGGAAR